MACSQIRVYLISGSIGLCVGYFIPILFSDCGFKVGDQEALDLDHCLVMLRFVMAGLDDLSFF